MDSNKSLILSLLSAELRHSRLINALRRIPLETEGRHQLELEGTIAELMQLKDDIPEQWYAIYNHYMDRVEPSDEDVSGLAEECYIMLWSCAQMQTQLGASDC